MGRKSGGSGFERSRGSEYEARAENATSMDCHTSSIVALRPL